MLFLCVRAVDLHGMEPWLLREALKVLEAEGKVRRCYYYYCFLCSMWDLLDVGGEC